MLLTIYDVLLAGSGETIAEIRKPVAFIENIETYAESDALVFRPHEMDDIYAGYLMNSHFVRQQLNKYGIGATVMHIYQSDLKKINVPKAALNNQTEIGQRLE